MFKDFSSAKSRHPICLLFALLAAIAVLTVVMKSEAFRQVIESITTWAEQLMVEHPARGAAAFFLVSGLSAILAFASSIVLVPAANLAWGKLLTFFLLWGGWMAGALLTYGIGKVARPLLNRFGYRDKLEKYQQYASNRMPFWALLLFCIAVPSEIPGYVFGSMRYSLPKFMAAIGIAEALYAIGSVAAGESIAVAEPGPVIGILILFVSMAAGAGMWLRRSRKRKNVASGYKSRKT